MLYELLAGHHPYWSEDQGQYARLVQAYAAKPPALVGQMPPPASNAEVSSILHRCLSPDQSARPTAAELRSVLSGRGEKAEVAKPSARVATSRGAGTPVVHPATASRAAADPIVADGIELLGPNGRALQIGVRTELGKALVRQFGPDGEFWDNRQCIIERNSGRQWMVSPIRGTTNETLVNGETLQAPRALRNGDQIAVGRQAKGVTKLPLAVRGR
jgi:hypothetical protein